MVDAYSDPFNNLPSQPTTDKRVATRGDIDVLNTWTILLVYLRFCTANVLLEIGSTIGVSARASHVFCTEDTHHVTETEMSLKNSQQKNVECDTKTVADNSTNMDLFSVSKVETSQKLEDATAKLETQETTDSCLDLSKKSESNTQQSPAEQDLATVTSSSQSPDIVKDINTNTNSQMEACDLSTSRSKLAEVSEQRSPVDYSQQHACDLSSKATPTTATRPPTKSPETSNSGVSDNTCTNNNDQVFDLSKKSSQPTHQQPSGNGGTANQVTKQAVCSNVDQKSTGSEHVTESKEQPERIYNLGKDSDAKITVNSSAVGSRSVRDLLAERRRSSESNSNVYVSGVDNLGNIRKTVDSIGTHRQLQNSGSVQQEENEIKVDKHDKDTSYGLVKIDGIWVPYVRRLSSGCQYVAVKTVEAKFLSRFPNVFPEELHRRGPLNSYSMSEEESRLLSEINQKCGITQVLGKNDLLVKLNDFDEFYRIVLRHFMKIRSNVPKSAAAPPRPPVSTAKWIQLNNTVIPCIETSGEKFLPISVVRHSAQLALDESVTGRKCTKEEMDNLNVACRNAGLDFTFSRTAHLVSITEIKRSGAEIYYLKELPGDNPKQHASPIDRLSPGNATNSKANNGLPPIVQGQVSTPSAAKHQNNTRGGMQMPMAGPTAAAALPQTSPQPAQQQQQQQQLHYQPQPQKHQQQQQQQQQQLHHQPQPQKHQQQLQQQHQQQQQFQQRQQLQRPDPVPVQNPVTPQQNSQQQQSLPIVQAPYQQVQNQSYQETNINTSLNSKTAYYPNREQSQRGFENQSQPNYHKIQPSPTNVPISPQNTEYSMRRTNVNVANQSGHINSSTTAQYSPPRPVNQPIHSSYSNQSASANYVQTNTMQPRGYNYQGHHQRATPAYSPTQPQHISPIPSPTGHTAHNAGDKSLPEHMQPTAMLPMKIAPNVNQQPKCPHTIIPYLFENYSISCLVKATVDEEFALLEAVSRLYFDDYKFSDLEHVLSVRLQVPLYTLSLPEEQAFITFYGLKTERLRSNQAISMRHFVRCYPSLREILPRKRPPRRPKTPELPAHSPRISGVAQGSSEQARNADYARRVFTEHVYQLQAQYNSDPRPMEHRGYKQHAEYAPQQRLQANAYSTNRPNYSLPMKRNHHDPRDLHSAPVAKSSRSYEYQTEAHYKPIA